MEGLKGFTIEEFNEVKAVMTQITHTIPEHLMGKVWNTFQRIENHRNPQPCSCQSSAKYWVQAVTTINNWIKSVNIDEQNG